MNLTPIPWRRFAFYTDCYLPGNSEFSFLSCSQRLRLCWCVRLLSDKFAQTNIVIIIDYSLIALEPMIPLPYSFEPAHILCRESRLRYFIQPDTHFNIRKSIFLTGYSSYITMSLIAEPEIQN